MLSVLLDALPWAVEPTHFLLPLVVVGLIFFATLRQASEPRAKSIYPKVGVDKNFFFFKKTRQRLYWFQKGPDLINSAFKQYKTAIFTLPAVDRTSIVLPPYFLPEIKALPESIASNSQATSDFFIGRHTTLDYDIFGHATIDAIKTQYITKIGSQIGPATDEAQYAFGKHFDTYKDWTPLVTQPKILNIVSQVVARTVIGPQVCRNPEWSKAVVGYAQNIFRGAVLLKLVPDIFHPIVSWVSPTFWAIHRCRRKIKEFAAPVILERIAWKRDDPAGWKRHVRADQALTVDYLADTSPPLEANVAMISHRITGVSFGAVHTTTNTITNALMDMANDFERWAPPLREEIKSVLGSGSSKMTNADLSKMWKLDSFLKESQRFHPPSQLSVNRKMLTDYTLSTGDVLPKSAHVSFAGVPMSLSGDYFEKAEEFDGFRFENLRRNIKTDHNGLQFTSSYAGSLHFGHGKYMCPGRFMGSLISKILLIEILQRYDLKLSGPRPENIRFFDMDIPNPEYALLFKDRAL